MSKPNFILIVILASLFAGCIDFQKQEQLEKIDNLSSSLDSVQQILIENKVENIDEISGLIEDINEKIQLLNDTISIDLAVLIDHFKITANSLSPLQSVYRYVDTNSQLVKLNLNNLKTDIEHANGNRAKYDEYIEFEQQKIDSLLLYIDSLILLKTALLDGVENYFSKLNTELDTQVQEVGMNLDNNL